MIKIKEFHLKYNLGCGKDILPGFINIDIQPYKGVDKIMDCADLSGLKSKSADLIFCHSFFEHLFLYQQFTFLKECKRILNDKGMLIILGIPDFFQIAKLYITTSPGIKPFGGTFGLYQAYRLTHGDCEDQKAFYLPQLHKALFDKQALSGLLQSTGYTSYRIFNYIFPKEQYPLALGVVAVEGDYLLRGDMFTTIKELRGYFDNVNDVIKLL